MKYKVEIYPYGVNRHGYFVQRVNKDRAIFMDKQKLIKLCYPYIRSKKEYFNVMSTDKHGNEKQQFELMSHNFLMIVNQIL